MIADTKDGSLSLLGVLQVHRVARQLSPPGSRSTVNVELASLVSRLDSDQLGIDPFLPFV